MDSKTPSFHLSSPQQELNLHRHTHSVQFYSDDAFLIDVLSRFMGSAVGAGDAAIVIATPQHRRALAERLAARGLDVERAVEQGRYVALDAAETLLQFMIADWPDEPRFVKLIGGVIAAQSKPPKASMAVQLYSERWSHCCGMRERAAR